MDKITCDKVLETTQSWDGVNLPNYPTTQPQITILHFKVPPKKKLDLHKHPLINAGYIIKGTLTVTIKDGITKDFHAGEAICECINTVHFGENKTDEEAELVVFYAGTPGLELSQKP
ncbi:MAG: cupin domain-containing protein [archaeon]|nr:cupin domain-containing protein [archaeon]